jgi:zinc protease
MENRVRITLLFTGLIASLASFASPATTQEFMLPNGLKLIVREDHRAPVVTVQIWYKVGSSYEITNHTGVSHILEHMMFKGTPTHPDGQFADIITKHGGVLNAFTSYDFTGYYESLPANQLETALILEADRMRNTTFSEENFKKELQVVIEERRMRTDDIPESLTFERFNATALVQSTYRNPVIGWPADLANATLEASKQWYDRWYRPNNAIVVIVGDVDPQKVHSLVQQHFASIAPQEVPSIQAIPELAQFGEKRIVVRRPGHSPYLFMGFQAPSYSTQTEPWHSAALTLLSSILDGGESSRLTKNLVRGQGLATQVFADYSTFMRQDYLFLFGGLPQQGRTLDELEQGIWLEIQKLQNERVTEKELARAKIQFKANDIYDRDDISTQANNIGSLEAIHLPWATKDKLLDQVEAITAEQLQAVAKQYLKREKLTVATLIPETGDAP